MMTQTPALFHHDRVLLLSDVTVVFINPDLKGTRDQFNVHLPLLLVDSIKTRLFQVKIILHGPKEALGLQACSLKLC
jgi:hypothetical protein